MDFAEMAEMIFSDYNSDALQPQAQGILETFRLDKYMSEHKMSSPSEGLTQFIYLIERLMSQF